MAATIEVEVTGSSPSPDTYKVQWRTLSATDMPEEIYVFEYATARMVRIAAPDDIQWPTTRTAGQPYYRQNLGHIDYASLNEAEAAKVNADIAIQDIVDHYKAGLLTFLGTTTKVYV